MKKIFVTIFTLSQMLQAECLVKDSNKQITAIKSDVLHKLLIEQASCPKRVQDLKSLLLQKGFSVEAAMVGNRGFNNGAEGSFSFFETVTGGGLQRGDFFFGHFTSLTNGIVHLDQEPNAGQLLIEAIAWDNDKKLFNFYELRGLKKSVQWFYRGDSADALADNAFLYRDVAAGKKKYGERMRCSACHNSGGPIMKELAKPNNDWWISKRPLSLSPNQGSAEVSSYLNELIEANSFAGDIKAGINKLSQSDTYKSLVATESLQEKLRPLFCETEINLESDAQPLLGSSGIIEIPSAFFVNPFFASASLSISKERYLALLSKFGMHFPETNTPDADHAWLAPVKGYSNHKAVEELIQRGFIDEDFAAKVYAIDFKTPLLSQKRCNLLKLLPSYSADWQKIFAERLLASTLPEALKLAKSLAALEHGRSYFEKEAQLYLQQKAEALENDTELERAFTELLESRQRVFDSEISQNPLGQILEPGFRVIFPEQRL